VAGARTELALTRCVPPTVPGGLAPAKPLRILLAVCSPVGLKQFDARQAVEDIERLAEHDRVEVRPLPNPRYSDLQRVISEEGWVPHVFHFIGHGDPDGLAIRMEEREQREHHAATGEASWEAKSINADQLSALFAEGSKPRLVFLHACEGAAPSSYASFADTARRLVGEDIPAVIAMRYSIVGEDAAAFAQRFYEQIGRGMPVDEAVTVARHHLANLPSDPKSWSNRRFGTPLLYLQSDAAVILEPPPRGEDARIRQPCPYEATKDCRASVFPEYRNCRACKGRLVWCSRDHANTPDEDQCAVCSEAIRTRQPVAPAPSPEAGSGFRVESSPWKT
jgi:hypothetical protein